MANPNITNCLRCVTFVGCLQGFSYLKQDTFDERYKSFTTWKPAVPLPASPISRHALEAAMLADIG